MATGPGIDEREQPMFMRGQIGPCPKWMAELDLTAETAAIEEMDQNGQDAVLVHGAVRVSNYWTEASGSG
jgi:hypothetical protein